MSNFTFLKTKEWQDLYQAAVQAERYTLADARTALFHGRRAIELMVEWLYAYDGAFRRPYNDSLSALMADAGFKEHVPHGVRQKMHAIRIWGNSAVHRDSPVRSADALAIIKELFHAAHWFGRTYTQSDPNAIPDQFDEKALPSPAREVARQSRAQLKTLAQAYLKRDEDLRQERETIAALKAELEALRNQVSVTKVVNEAIPDTYDYDYTEAETRRLLIDVLLREVGWEISQDARNWVFDKNPVSAELEPLRRELADALHQTVQTMNLNNFIVRPKRPYVEPFQQRGRWDNLSRSDIADLSQHVAGLPAQLPDEPETAKRFDLLIYHLQLSLLHGETKAVESLQNRVMQMAFLLNEKGSIPAVQARMALIQRVQTEAYWQEITLPQLEDLRRALRDLTRFIERPKQNVVVTDFTDEFGKAKPTYLPEVSQGVNIIQYRRKVEQFIRANEDAVVICKIRWAMPLTPENLDALDEILFPAEAVGSESEFARAFGTPSNLAEFVRGLVGLDRQAAKEKFARFLDGNNYNADQIQFVNFIIDHLTKNGIMEPRLLWERPFVDLHDAGPDGLFVNEDAETLLETVRQINRATIVSTRTPPTNY
ncbi:MAG: DUF4145 domain-containing protein [Chloroflexi bacterium]|nr:DUF4145 domain-containing protein [Chloroflexota bacterium]